MSSCRLSHGYSISLEALRGFPMSHTTVVSAFTCRVEVSSLGFSARGLMWGWARSRSVTQQIRAAHFSIHPLEFNVLASLPSHIALPSETLANHSSEVLQITTHLSYMYLEGEAFLKCESYTSESWWGMGPLKLRPSRCESWWGIIWIETKYLWPNMLAPQYYDNCHLLQPLPHLRHSASSWPGGPCMRAESQWRPCKLPTSEFG